MEFEDWEELRQSNMLQIVYVHDRTGKLTS